MKKSITVYTDIDNYTCPPSKFKNRLSGRYEVWNLLAMSMLKVTPFRSLAWLGTSKPMHMSQYLKMQAVQYEALIKFIHNVNMAEAALLISSPQEKAAYQYVRNDYLKFIYNL